MNKKLNWLAMLPVFGSVILIASIFIKVKKEEIAPKKFIPYFALFILAIPLTFIPLTIGINWLITHGYEHWTTELSQLVWIVGGYIYNIFVFVLLNKNWNKIVDQQPVPQSKSVENAEICDEKSIDVSMNKKLNYLAVLPLLGSTILLIWLFVKALKKQINSRKLFVYFVICSVVAMLIHATALVAELLVAHGDISTYQPNAISILIQIIGGYLVNVFVFIFINKKWKKLLETSQ